jgi:PAS domain S-box-containing protein/putative nucleotidyltransferase with HDIG domain
MAAELQRAGLAFDWQRVDGKQEFAARLDPPPDLILSDFQMPQFTGLQALEMLRARGLDVPFIIVSGTIGEEIAVTALQSGAADYLLKDRLTRLGAAAGQALEARRLRDTERLAEQTLRESEQRYRSLFEGVPVGLYRSTPSGQLLDANPAMVRMLGYPDRESLLRVGAADLYVDPTDRQTWREPLERQGVLEHYENRLRRYDGTVIWVRGAAAAVRGPEDRVQYYEGSLEDITDRRLAEEQLAGERTLLRTLIDSLPDYISVKDPASRFLIVNDAYARFAGKQQSGEMLGKTVFDVFPPHLAARYVQDDQAVLRHGQPLNLETETVNRENQPRWHAVTKVPLQNHAGETIGLVAIARDITERKRAEEQITNQVQQLSTLHLNAQKLSQSLDQAELASYVVETVVRTLGGKLAWLIRAEVDGAINVLTHFPADPDGPRSIGTHLAATGSGVAAEAIRTGVPVILHEREFEPRIPPEQIVVLREYDLRSLGAFPLISRDRTFGVVVACSDQDEFFTTARSEFIQTFVDQAAAALETARLFEEAEMRVQQLQALRNIDMAITASLDLRVTLNVILDQVATHLKAHAATVLLFDPSSQTLRFAVSRGFRSKALQKTNLRLGEGHAGRAAQERRIINIPDLAAEMAEFSRSPKLPDEGFTAYIAVPLVAKGQIKGVLEVLNRTPWQATADWLGFLEALAGQAAIAIDNSGLFDNLQRTNLDLLMAYDKTLEGWSKALDLRDKETEGHALRVTQLTAHLARTMGVNDDDLVHVRRGALLHDIGKMAIPDSILLKPGPLTDEEWVTMKKHPVYAYELLSPIPYLRLALDIPYCHHEKWEGTGYPRRLKGEAIPIAARIFAIVDVYDALTSDRPYRPAWSKQKALAYIREQSGKHFDPQVVEAFLLLDLPGVEPDER